MLNKDIKYNLSRDYDRLYKLLKEGNTIIGLIRININNNVSKEYSKLIELSYNPKYKKFDIGFTLFEEDYDFEEGGINEFYDICEMENIRFIDIE